MSELTEWMPASMKPVRRGVYNVSCRSEQQSGQWFAYWNGRSFGYFTLDKNDLKFMKQRQGAVALSWRGRLKDAK